MPNKDERTQIAQTIIDQLGGLGKISAMVGANNFLIEEAGISFQFKGCRKAKKCIIDLLPSDLYRMRLGKLNRKTLDFDILHEEEGLYWDMLKPEFERATGLDLSL